MPYIDLASRQKLDDDIEALARKIKGPGELNYIVTRLAMRTEMGLSGYAEFAMLTGVLENIKQEMYRRAVSPYEDEKIKQNGDVEEYE